MLGDLILLFDRLKKISLSCFTLLLILFIVSCDPNFDPLEKNDKYHFSFYGYLDASADTQWVRVMPVRDSLFFSPQPLDALVTIESLDDGKTATLKDTLFSFSGGRYAWNYWTTMDIEPGGYYRLAARNSEGQLSSLNVELPPDYPTPEVLIADTVFTNDDDKVFIDGVDQLVDARTVYQVKNTQSGGGDSYFTISHLQDSSTTVSGTYLVTVNPYIESDEVKSRLSGGASLVKKQIYVAAAGTGFDAFSFEDDPRRNLPEGITNVEHGVGYVAGIVSKTIPYKSCVDDSERVIPCPLESPPW
ncbi:hypothetical protein NC796_14285 [Aliifodinibius sp. S!AR15-10]|uniref:hypothetical protein n=1 Tax=Aliifodinibius sp. S!AR15-10 TaxID=2950437 RepID=UPI00285A2207|nr:hypothetical protein [Aliifodinibius sp. S!AR15-10]MDR8392318.1 hypothetical protein [Aliifodinibius sp. S!AR15-10]